MPNEIERLNERIKAASFRADYFERECEQLQTELAALAAWQCASCGARFAETVSPHRLVGTTQCSKCVEVEMLMAKLRQARAEATSVRPGPCTPERADEDERMFWEL